MDGGGEPAVGADGRSEGEAASEDSTTARLYQAETGLLRSFGGGVGNAAAAGVSIAQNIGTRAAAVGSDLSNQMGVGHLSYYPDLNGMRRRIGSPADYTSGGDGNTNADQPSGQGGTTGPPPTPPAHVLADPSSPISTEPQMPAVRDSTGGGAGVGGRGVAAGEAAEAAATVPIVPI